VCTEIPADVTDGERLHTWLDHHLQAHGRCERLVVYHRLSDSGQGDLESLVKIALSFCVRHQSRKRWMRILFLFDPSATWRWLSLPQNRREELENSADAIVLPHCWNLSGIRQRLAQHDKLHSDEVCQLVLRATGGWPLLLDTLFERCSGRDDPRPVAQTIGRELVEAGSALGQQFRPALGLEVNAIVHRILEFVLRENEVPVDLVTPELIGGEPALHLEECMCAVEYLRRMGCVMVHSDTISAETTVKGVMVSP
jgi:hypothetical protein